MARLAFVAVVLAAVAACGGGAAPAPAAEPAPAERLTEAEIFLGALSRDRGWFGGPDHALGTSVVMRERRPEDAGEPLERFTNRLPSLTPVGRDGKDRMFLHVFNDGSGIMAVAHPCGERSGLCVYLVGPSEG